MVPLAFLNSNDSNVFLLKVRNLHSTSICSTSSIASQEFQEIRSDASSLKR